MQRTLAALLLGLTLSSCSREFAVYRDYGRVADCYAAFFSVHMDARDPALDLSEAAITAKEGDTMRGINRMTPFIVEAEKQAGGDQKFLQLVAAWRRRKENDIGLAPTIAARKAVYNHVLSEAARCHQTLDKWGAAKAYTVAAPDPIPADPIAPVLKEIAPPKP
ncbi:MAG: hypothetical protein WCI21_00955 [Alphaproteobacteria bacterium]